MIDLYEVLQVHRGADPVVIRAAYRALARRNHPDFGGNTRQMALLNAAWTVLGDPERRAAYDAEPQALRSSPTSPKTRNADRRTFGQPANGTPRGLAGRRLQQPRAGGSVLSFGRYAGWTVGSLVDQDSDYLAWLARTPIGRHLATEIDEALAQRADVATARRPTAQQPARRRAFH
jgi:curved DNA-binding protein CbpA